ncbi:SUF system NifU family Fe-S cluster assembly protein, partial [Myxococcota bacterium]|nr:SUF system NifU family Fe-S cluster assembly protein [Myxococcota bacterium]
MNSEVRDLYQEVILDHNKHPKNFRAIENPTHHADGHNPLCGDTVTVYLTITDEVITDISFVGQGCAISKASASMMTQAVKGKGLAEARAIFEDFRVLVTGERDIDSDVLGKLAVFEGLREYPTRVKCATLVWHTFQSALNDSK